MKKNIKEIFRKGLFVTIAGYDVYFPIGEKWDSIDEALGSAVDMVNLLINLSAVAAVAMIIIGGYTYITSAGDPDKAEQAQKTLTGSIIGLGIVFVVKLIFLLIMEFFVNNPSLVD